MLKTGTSDTKSLLPSQIYTLWMSIQLMFQQHCLRQHLKPQVLQA